MNNSFRVNVLNTLSYLQKLTVLLIGSSNFQKLTSLCISSTGGCCFRQSHNAPFIMNGDTRNSCGPSSYIPNKGSINRWERDRHASASVYKSFLIESFVNRWHLIRKLQMETHALLHDDFCKAFSVQLAVHHVCLWKLCQNLPQRWLEDLSQHQ